MDPSWKRRGIIMHTIFALYADDMITLYRKLNHILHKTALQNVTHPTIPRAVLKCQAGYSQAVKDTAILTSLSINWI